SSQPDMIIASLSARRSSNFHDRLYHHCLTERFSSGPTASFYTESFPRCDDNARRVAICGAFEPSGQHLGTASETLQKLNQCPP
ncbi:hypothetical protein QBC32DRAFT_199260, partial [Pseudoneurospora amorphoporcata]